MFGFVRLKSYRATLVDRYGSCSIMVYYRRYYGKCHVCKQCRPSSWFRCNLCGIWMGMHCNPKQVPFASKNEDEDRRFQHFEVALHCYVWTSTSSFRAERADLCCVCVETKVLANVAFGVPCDFPDLPAHVKRRILKFVEWGSWW